MTCREHIIAWIVLAASASIVLYISLVNPAVPKAVDSSIFIQGVPSQQMKGDEGAE